MDIYRDEVKDHLLSGHNEVAPLPAGAVRTNTANLKTFVSAGLQLSWGCEEGSPVLGACTANGPENETGSEKMTA